MSHEFAQFKTYQSRFSLAISSAMPVNLYPVFTQHEYTAEKDTIAPTILSTAP